MSALEGPQRGIPQWASSLIVCAAFGVLVHFENRQALRREKESKLRRNARNLAVAGLSGAVMSVAERPIAMALARWTEKEQFGLVYTLPVPEWVRQVTAVILMDYTLYLWHVLTHKVPFLWRFHLVHHIDRDLDASTALRFHCCDIALSVPFRAAQVVLIGTSVLAFTWWQMLLFISILFHHSNVRLPLRSERLLNLLLVTPRLHGIHHDARLDHTNANWSSGLSVWDRLHGTYLANVPQETVDIGVPAYRAPGDVTLARSLAVPFRPQRKDWEPGRELASLR